MCRNPKILIFSGSHFVFRRFEGEKLKIQLGIRFFHNQHKKVSLKSLDTNFYSEMPLPENIQEYGLVYIEYDEKLELNNSI